MKNRTALNGIAWSFGIYVVFAFFASFVTSPLRVFIPAVMITEIIFAAICFYFLFTNKE